MVAFFGLGTMGRPMALRLCDAGHQLVILKRSGAAKDLLARGARAARSPVDAVRNVDVVVLSVPDSTAVEGLVYGDGGFLNSMEPGSIVIDMGTSDPASTRRVSGDLYERGVEMLDAPVSGGESAAAGGTLSCMVGGSKEAFTRALPLLQHVAKNINYVGGTGTGHTMKLLNNMIGLGNLGVLCEAMSVARRIGVDLELAIEIFGTGSANSRALEFWGNRLIEQDYDAPSYRFDLALKDVTLIQRVATTSGLPCTLFDALYSIFMLAAGLGASQQDVSVIKANWDQLY